MKHYTRKGNDDLVMIVECKQKKRVDGIAQLKTYMDLCPAVIGVWYNGEEHCYLRKSVDDRGVNQYGEMPTIPIAGQRIEDIGQFARKDLKATLNLRQVFKDIRNVVAGSGKGITRDETIAGEIINILFCKIYDELNTAPDEILEFRHGVNESPSDVGGRTRNLFEKVLAEYADVFADSDRIRLDDKCLAYVVGELQMYSVTAAERDIIGEAFEVFIGPALKGSQGQFFTPRNIVRTAVQIIDPSSDDKILDPACGSGGFLVVALEYVWAKLQKEASERGHGRRWLERKERIFAESNIRGVDKDAFLAKITKAYMAIVGDGRGGIFCENSLQDQTDWSTDAAAKVEDESFDLILTNPPFGAKITIADKDILDKYELGHKWTRCDGNWVKTSSVLSKQPPQILFIERCHRLLKPGGKLGIILPDGVLGGTRIGYVPQFVRANFNVVTLIDCPAESFSPNTSTKVHLLVLEKKSEDSRQSPVFMSVTEVNLPRFSGHIEKIEFTSIRRCVYVEETSSV